MEYPVELLWYGAFKTDFLLCYGVDELQHFGMEAEAVDRGRLVAVAILAVADDGASFGGEMHAYLVGASGLQMELDEGIN